jgi:hypothetical protein
MVVVLCQSDDVTFRRDLQTATSTHLHIWTLKLSNERAITLKYCHMESVSMAVTYQHIACITDVNTIWVVGYVLTADTTLEVTLFIEDHNTMPLKEFMINRSSRMNK